MFVKKINPEASFHLEDYKELVEEINDVIYRIDKDKKIIFVNKAIKKLTGFTKEEMIGKNFLDLVYKEDLEKITNDFNNLFIKKEYYPSKYRIVTKDNQTVWVKSQSRLITSQEKIVGAQGALFDINEGKLKKIKLKEQNQELLDFAYRVSHDLKGPLCMIVGYLELIKEDHNCIEKMYDHVNKICQNTIDFVDQLLRLSKTGEVIAQKEEIDLRIIVKSIYHQYKNTKDRFELEWDDKSIMIFADFMSIKEVFQNLIENSIKYKKENEILKIEISTEIIGNDTIIEIKDNGAGIKKEILPLIFKKGFTFRTNGQRGTGFGLSIVKKIIEAHNGEIWAESEGKNKGANFYIKLPSQNK